MGGGGGDSGKGFFFGSYFIKLLLIFGTSEYLFSCSEAVLIFPSIVLFLGFFLDKNTNTWLEIPKQQN